MTENTFDFVSTIMRRFSDAHIHVWLAGGWAEELHWMRPPGQHSDIDLLYPAASFDHLDHWLAHNPDVTSIPAKRFSHKRAFLCEHIMIEVILLEPSSTGYVTNFFDGRYQLHWPADPLDYLDVEGQFLPIANEYTLLYYRQAHEHVVRAYEGFLNGDTAPAREWPAS